MVLRGNGHGPGCRRCLGQGSAARRPPGPPQAYERKGLLHRWFHHSAATLQDKMIGYPENFVEPPLGY